MIAMGARVQRLVTGVAFVGVLALSAETASATYLLTDPPWTLAAAFDLERSGVSLGHLRVDVDCTGSVFVILIAVSIGLQALAHSYFQRALSFLEGAATGVLAVRLACDFFPTLLEAHPFSGAPHFFLGYPLVPFWLSAGSASLLIGVAAEHKIVQVFITAFLGAFAAAKGVRTLRDAAAGRDGFEIAGGSDIKADFSNGCVQLGLFVVGMWMRHACRGKQEEEEGCCAWCECCLDEEEKALRREKQTQDRIDQAVSEYEAYSHVGPPPAGPAPNPPTPPLRTSMSNPRMSQNTSGRMPSNPRSSIMRQSTGQRYNSML